MASGERLEQSNAQSILLMQETETDVSRINHTGDPEGVVSANPSSLSHDPVSGNVYRKATGTGNTGWVNLQAGGSGIGSIGVDATSGSGTNPVLPTTGGLVTVNGAVIASSTTPVRTVATAANVYQLQVQTGQAIVATDATRIGLVALNSAQFTVDANGFVSASATGIATTITGNSGGALSPASNNWNVVGGVNFFTAGAASTLTGRSDIVTYLQPGAYPYTALDTDYFISVDTTAPRTINLPNAPTTGKSYVIKDRVGSAASNNITITTVGGVVLIDGVTSRAIQSNYGSINIVFNGTSYEIW